MSEHNWPTQGSNYGMPQRFTDPTDPRGETRAVILRPGNKGRVQWESPPVGTHSLKVPLNVDNIHVIYDDYNTKTNPYCIYVGDKNFHDAYNRPEEKVHLWVGTVDPTSGEKNNGWYQGRLRTGIVCYSERLSPSEVAIAAPLVKEGFELRVPEWARLVPFVGTFLREVHLNPAQGRLPVVGTFQGAGEALRRLNFSNPQLWDAAGYTVAAGLFFNKPLQAWWRWRPLTQSAGLIPGPVKTVAGVATQVGQMAVKGAALIGTFVRTGKMKAAWGAAKTAAVAPPVAFAIGGAYAGYVLAETLHNLSNTLTPDRVQWRHPEQVPESLRGLVTGPWIWNGPSIMAGDGQVPFRLAFDRQRERAMMALYPGGTTRRDGQPVHGVTPALLWHIPAAQPQPRVVAEGSYNPTTGEFLRHPQGVGQEAAQYVQDPQLRNYLLEQALQIGCTNYASCYFYVRDIEAYRRGDKSAIQAITHAQLQKLLEAGFTLREHNLEKHRPGMETSRLNQWIFLLPDYNNGILHQFYSLEDLDAYLQRGAILPTKPLAALGAAAQQSANKPLAALGAQQPTRTPLGQLER